MRKILLLFMLLLTVAFLSSGQDIRPIGCTNLQSPSFSVYLPDGSIYIWKNSTLGFTKILSADLVQAKIDSVLYHRVPYTGARTEVDLNTQNIKSSSQNLPIYIGVVTLPTLTKNSNGTVTIGGDGVATFNTLADGSGNNVRLACTTGATLTPTDNSVSYVYLDYNNGTPIYAIASSSIQFLTNAKYVPVLRVVRINGTTLHFEEYDQYGTQLAPKQLFKDINVNGAQRASGLILSTSPTRISSVSAGTVWFGVQVYNVSTNTAGSLGTMYEYYLTAGVWNTSTVTSYDASYYSDGTDRQTLLPNKWVAKYFFRDVGDDNEVYYIHGDHYSKEIDAYNEPVPTLPLILSSHTIYVGKITIQQGTANGMAYPRTWGQTVVMQGAANHSDLTNLSWLNSGHTGDVNTIAAFDGSGTATNTTKGTFTENIDGIVLSDSTRQVIGGATVLGLKAGRVIPTSTQLDSYVSKTTTVNGQALSGNVSLALDDISNVTAPTPASGDILKWSGTQWISGANTPVVGSSPVFYLDPLVALADNLMLQPSPSVSPEVVNSKTVSSALGLVFFERFVSNPLGRTSIPAGTWDFDIYGSNTNGAGSNLIQFRVNKRVEQVGMTGTWTGTGAVRTFTVTGGEPFVAGDANANRLLASLVETPNQTGWISAFINTHTVSVYVTDIAYVNQSNVSLNAIYYYLFNSQTANITSSTPALYNVSVTEPLFTVKETDRIVIALFCSTDGTPSRTMSLYYGGAINYSHFNSPLSTLHNDLAGLNVGDYKHLTVPEYTIATQPASISVSGYVNTSTQTFAGVKTFNSLPESSATPTTTVQLTNKAYVDTKEPSFSKNSGFNLNLGTSVGTVLEGRTFGTAANSATTDFLSSSVNPYNSSVSFNPNTKELSVVDAGGTKTSTINLSPVQAINAYYGTVTVTTTQTSVTWPQNFSHSGYRLDVKAYYNETINGKNVRIQNAQYDFVKTISGFSTKVDTIAGCIEYLAQDSTNLYPLQFSNYFPKDSVSIVVGTVGRDTRVPSEKSVRTELNLKEPIVTKGDFIENVLGLELSSARQVIGGSTTLTLTTGYLIPTTASQTTWDAGYSDRLKWDGGATGLVAATGRTSLGATTIGQSMFMSMNPSAISFGRANADNTFDWLSAANFKTAIGGGITNAPQIIKFDTGITEGTDIYTFNGTATKTININAGTNITLTKAANNITINASSGGGGASILDLVGYQEGGWSAAYGQILLETWGLCRAQVGYASVSYAIDDDGNYILQGSDGTVGYPIYAYNTSRIRLSNLPSMSIKFGRSSTATSRKLNVGLSSAGTAPYSITATNLVLYCNSGSNRFMFGIGNGTAHSEIDTGIDWSTTSTYIFVINTKSTTEVDLLLYNSSYTLLASYTATTNLPGLTTVLFAGASASDESGTFASGYLKQYSHKIILKR